MPKISVIIPVYNTEKYLQQCLDSVLAQTLKDIEIICVNDGSTDGSAKILDEYAANDKRIKVVHKKNEGVAKAKNKGLQTATGKFVAFMDSDDMYPDENVLKDLYDAATKHKVNICGGSLYLYTDGKIIPSNETQYVFAEDGIILYKDYQYDYGFTRFIYNREFLQKNDISFPLYCRVEDPPFFIKAMGIAKKFYALKRVVYWYRTSHKIIKWTADMVADSLTGFYDCSRLADKYKYDKLKKIILSRLNTEYWLNIIFPFHRNAKVVKIMKMLAKNYKDSLNPLYYSYNYPAISVIVPVYNAEKYLQQCLDSVVNQTFKDIEIICVNDGSPDNSLAILQCAENCRR